MEIRKTLGQLLKGATVGASAVALLAVGAPMASAADLDSERIDITLGDDPKPDDKKDDKKKDDDGDEDEGGDEDGDEDGDKDDGEHSCGEGACG